MAEFGYTMLARPGDAGEVVAAGDDLGACPAAAGRFTAAGSTPVALRRPGAERQGGLTRWAGAEILPASRR
jgi:hypothetical protein